MSGRDLFGAAPRAGKSEAMAEVDCEVLNESRSGLAWRIAGPARHCWVPKSEVTFLDKDGAEVLEPLALPNDTVLTARMPEWLAHAEGLI